MGRYIRRPRSDLDLIYPSIVASVPYGIDYPYLSATIQKIILQNILKLFLISVAFAYSELHTYLIHEFLRFTAKRLIGFLRFALGSPLKPN